MSLCNRAEVERFLDEQRARVAFLGTGIPPRTNLLLHGPPGNGKTMVASAIATELRWPGFVVQLNEVLGSYLGITSNNLSRVWAAAKLQCVLLLDELDVLASTRGAIDSAAGKEWNATVGTLLKLLDERPQGVVIGATNRPDMLDPAIRRRFDVEIEMPAPSEAEKHAFAQRLNDRYGTTTQPDGHTSYDAVEKAVLHNARTRVLEEWRKRDER
jgi:SpoVK/Ycf46/Vps4 family AAA+-type ATPase